MDILLVAYGAASEDHKGPEPEAAAIEEMGFGWSSDYKSGVEGHTTALKVLGLKTQHNGTMVISIYYSSMNMN